MKRLNTLRRGQLPANMCHLLLEWIATVNYKLALDKIVITTI